VLVVYSPTVRLNPYLHIDAERIYNPLTDRALSAGEDAFARLRAFADGRGDADDALAAEGWVVGEGDDLSRRHRLKIVSLETLTTCNQKCYFCPVSIAPRPDEEMPVALFERIVEELMPFRDTLEGVFLQSYNEPTIDRRFVDLVRTLFAADLPVAVLSNASGLTPARVESLMQAGTLRYLCINLSTLDRERYQADRGADHLDLVLRNLELMRDKEIADDMRIVVLGEMDDRHRADFDAISQRFAGSKFTVMMHHATDRAGWLDLGLNRPEPIRHLAGCDLMGSRPIQHLHITPSGKCVLCCQDYDENYVVGDVTGSSILEVLEGPEMAKMRRWTYGVEEAPDDFICRTCVWALQRP
jgi:MoaA/NifB/PqqE/SkfB family radical SAM enzyme